MTTPEKVSGIGARAQTGQVVVKLGDIVEDPRNARQNFDPASLKELAASIKAQGILQAPLARRRKDGKVQLIDGHRRYRAAQLAGLKEIRVDLVDVDDKTAALAAATANLQREDLTEYEQALAFQHALELGMEKKKLGELAGVSYNTIMARLAILELPELVAKKVGQGGFGMAHAKLLLPLAKDAKALAVGLEAMKADAGQRGDVVGIKEAPEILASALIEKKVAVDLSRAARIEGSTWDPNAKKRLAALATKTKAFTLGDGYRAQQLALASTPGLTDALKATRDDETKRKAKRNVGTSHRSPQETPAQRQAREEREAAERLAAERADLLIRPALAKARGKITSPMLVEIIVSGREHVDSQHVDAVCELLALPKPKTKLKGYSAGANYIGAQIGKLSFDAAARALALWALLPAFGGYRDHSVDKHLPALTGKSWAEWITAAKSHIRGDAKAKTPTSTLKSAPKKAAKTKKGKA